MAIARFDGVTLCDWAMRFLGGGIRAAGASWEGLSAARARKPLFRRIYPLFRLLQRRFYVNTLNLQ
jgi:hypothetical protein